LLKDFRVKPENDISIRHSLSAEKKAARYNVGQPFFVQDGIPEKDMLSLTCVTRHSLSAYMTSHNFLQVQ